MGLGGSGFWGFFEQSSCSRVANYGSEQVRYELKMLGEARDMLGAWGLMIMGLLKDDRRS